MEIVVIIVMIMVIFSFLLKMTYLPMTFRVLVCMVIAFIEWETQEYAASQSKTQIADWLQNQELMLDVAILLTIDVLMQITYCILEAKQLSGERLSKSESALRHITLMMPGILIFPTLIAIHVETIFAYPGMDFKAIAWSISATILIIGTFVPMLLKRLLPEWDLRLELIFIINVLIAMLGVVATVDGRTVAGGRDSIELQPLIGIIVILTLGAMWGYIKFLRKPNKISN